MSNYVDTEQISTSKGTYTIHILVGAECEWLWEPYTVLIEPNKHKEYMFVFQKSLFELGPTPIQEDIGSCEFCGSDVSISPCFRTTSYFDYEQEDIRDYFNSKHSPLCIDCIKEFQIFVTETIPENYSEHILLGNL